MNSANIFRKALLTTSIGVWSFVTAINAHASSTTTPIKHVIVVVGENHTFDNVFGGYRPTNGQEIDNLLSKHIIRADGLPGPNFSAAVQHTADPAGVYSIDPARTGTYAHLKQPDTTYAEGQPQGVPDARFPTNLANGPFQLTRYVADDAYTGDPVHRFFQMWQEVGHGATDLFVWVAQTVGVGVHTSGNFVDNTHQGGVAMGFYNMSTGDLPLLAEMAHQYAISDNYHQAIMGGTGANFLAIASGDAAFYNDNGNPVCPPTAVSTTVNGVPTLVSQVENPIPSAVSGNPNWYQEDGYSGGSYVNCADTAQPGVKAIRNYLESKHVPANCADGHYYLVNNYGLGYTANGGLVDRNAKPFTLPPQPASLPTIADALSDAGVSWKWYIGARGNGANPGADYCGICDPLTAFTSVMTNPSKLANLQDVNVLYNDVAKGTLPEVAFVRPPEAMAGHPANSEIAAYQNYVTDLINMVHNNPELWNSTAIILTMDEGGGYFDSGYVQPVDFFGDGTRIPLIVVSPYAKQGHVDHTYNDHVSILKFIEHNWGLKPLSKRSRDNLPNPIQVSGKYEPQNSPAIGDLMSLFDFSRFRANAPSIKLPKPVPIAYHDRDDDGWRDDNDK